MSHDAVSVRSAGGWPGGGFPLRLEKAANARDLGGYRGLDGRTVRRGMVFRADSLHRLSPADVATLGRLGLSGLIDFRSPDEITQVGVDRLPTPGPSRLVSLPLSDPEHTLFASVAVMLGRADGSSLPPDAVRDPAGAMRAMNRWFVTSPLARQTCAAALRIIADPAALPLLFHCTAGKDRTGWLSAILLSALGVSRDDVLADYVRTTELNAASNEYLMTVLAQRMDNPRAIMPLLEARPDYLEAGLDEADRVYGSIDAYLRTALSLDDSTLTSLHSNLLTPLPR